MNAQPSVDDAHQPLGFFSTDGYKRPFRFLNGQAPSPPTVHSDPETDEFNLICELRNKYPHVCYAISPAQDQGSDFTFHPSWFWDEWDFHRLGPEFCFNVINRIIRDNHQVLHSFIEHWVKANPTEDGRIPPIVLEGTIHNLFATCDIEKYGTVFLEKVLEKMRIYYHRCQTASTITVRDVAAHNPSTPIVIQPEVGKPVEIKARPKFPRSEPTPKFSTRTAMSTPKMNRPFGDMSDIYGGQWSVHGSKRTPNQYHPQTFIPMHDAGAWFPGGPSFYMHPTAPGSVPFPGLPIPSYQPHPDDVQPLVSLPAALSNPPTSQMHGMLPPVSGLIPVRDVSLPPNASSPHVRHTHGPFHIRENVPDRASEASAPGRGKTPTFSRPRKYSSSRGRGKQSSTGSRHSSVSQQKSPEEAQALTFGGGHAHRNSDDRKRGGRRRSTLDRYSGHQPSLPVSKEHPENDMNMVRPGRMQDPHPSLSAEGSSLPGGENAPKSNAIATLTPCHHAIPSQACAFGGKVQNLDRTESVGPDSRVTCDFIGSKVDNIDHLYIFAHESHEIADIVQQVSTVAPVKSVQQFVTSLGKRKKTISFSTPEETRKVLHAFSSGAKQTPSFRLEAPRKHWTEFSDSSWTYRPYDRSKQYLQMGSRWADFSDKGAVQPLVATLIDKSGSKSLFVSGDIKSSTEAEKPISREKEDQRVISNARSGVYTSQDARSSLPTETKDQLNLVTKDSEARKPTKTLTKVADPSIAEPKTEAAPVQGLNREASSKAKGNGETGDGETAQEQLATTVPPAPENEDTGPRKPIMRLPDEIDAEITSNQALVSSSIPPKQIPAQQSAPEGQVQHSQEEVRPASKAQTKDQPEPSQPAVESQARVEKEPKAKKSIRKAPVPIIPALPALPVLPKLRKTKPVPSPVSASTLKTDSPAVSAQISPACEATALGQGSKLPTEESMGQKPFAASQPTMNESKPGSPSILNTTSKDAKQGEQSIDSEKDTRQTEPIEGAAKEALEASVRSTELKTGVDSHSRSSTPSKSDSSKSESSKDNEKDSSTPESPASGKELGLPNEPKEFRDWRGTLQQAKNFLSTSKAPEVKVEQWTKEAQDFERKLLKVAHRLSKEVELQQNAKTSRSKRKRNSIRHGQSKDEYKSQRDELALFFGRIRAEESQAASEQQSALLKAVSEQESLEEISRSFAEAGRPFKMVLAPDEIPPESERPQRYFQVITISGNRSVNLEKHYARSWCPSSSGKSIEEEGYTQSSVMSRGVDDDEVITEEKCSLHNNLTRCTLTEHDPQPTEAPNVEEDQGSSSAPAGPIDLRHQASSVAENCTATQETPEKGENEGRGRSSTGTSHVTRLARSVTVESPKATEVPNVEENRRPGYSSPVSFDALHGASSVRVDPPTPTETPAMEEDRRSDSSSPSTSETVGGVGSLAVNPSKAAEVPDVEENQRPGSLSPVVSDVSGRASSPGPTSWAKIASANKSSNMNLQGQPVRRNSDTPTAQPKQTKGKARAHTGLGIDLSDPAQNEVLAQVGNAKEPKSPLGRSSKGRLGSPGSSKVPNARAGQENTKAAKGGKETRQRSDDWKVGPEGTWPLPGDGGKQGGEERKKGG